jgi:Lar family restriction alleviation protein
MTITSDRLKSCPFCGSEGVVLVGSFVRCGNCGATGPFGRTAEDAIARWNERPGVGIAGSLQTALPQITTGTVTIKKT